MARATYFKARALVSLASGDIEAARREATEAVSVDPMGINAWDALAIQARAALWLGDVEGARAALTAMKAFPRPAGGGGAAHSGGRVGCPRGASGGSG